MSEINELYEQSVKYAITPASPRGSILFTHKMEAFKAGAEWQKERQTRLIALIKEAIPVLLTEGFDDLVEQIDNELEQLK